MCRHIYYWNIVACDVKQPIKLKQTKLNDIRKDFSDDWVTVLPYTTIEIQWNMIRIFSSVLVFEKLVI